MSYIMTLEQATSLKKVVEELQPYRRKDDDLHLTTLQDGTRQIRVQLTESMVSRYISVDGLVASKRWDD